MHAPFSRSFIGSTNLITMFQARARPTRPPATIATTAVCLLALQLSHRDAAIRVAGKLTNGDAVGFQLCDVQRR